MKNLIIVLLSCLCVFVYLRGLNSENKKWIKSGVPTSTRESSEPPPDVVSKPVPKGLKDNFEPQIVQSTEATVARINRLELRLAATKEVALRYARYFAKRGLSREKADLLIELLVDQKMLPFEPEMQLLPGKTGGGSNANQDAIDEGARQNQKFIETLLGPEETARLYSDSLEQMFETKSFRAVEVLNANGEIAAVSNPQVQRVLGNFNPMQGLDTLVNERQEITPTVEASFREQQSRHIEAAIVQLGGYVSLEQIAALREWSRIETDKALEFAKVHWILNNRGR